MQSDICRAIEHGLVLNCTLYIWCGYSPVAAKPKHGRIYLDQSHIRKYLLIGFHNILKPRKLCMTLLEALHVLVTHFHSSILEICYINATTKRYVTSFVWLSRVRIG